jgi:hypothetical protein
VEAGTRNASASTGTRVRDSPGHVSALVHAREPRVHSQLLMSDPRVPAPGVVLSERYVLRRPLRRGGMGTVWEADHLALGVAIALKVMDARIANDADMITRFKREAQAAAALRSPHVVQILDFGVDEGIAFIAMELLVGESLGDRLRRIKRLSASATARIAGQIGRGIGRAHAGGVVHRDLKPDNVFLVGVDDDEIAKVLDFGIAKVTGADVDALTRSGAALGTLHYMSPEQLAGRRDLDQRADLWALAVIVFECVCGRVPFDASAIGELVLQITTRPLPIPSTLAAVPRGFDEWFARAASREPSKRYPNAREMCEALTRVVDEGGLVSDQATTQLQRTASASRATTATKLTGGTERAGFEIDPDPAARVLTLVLWGTWDLAIADAFRAGMLRTLDALKGRPWVVLQRSARYPPQKPEIQKIHRELMPLAEPCGMTHAAVVVDSALSQMQTRRLFEESGAPNIHFFNDEGAARAWLATKLERRA